MDDPWGSPWAEESLDAVPKISIEPAQKSIEPKKSLQLPDNPSSPWDDDADFGEWASFPIAKNPRAVVDGKTKGLFEDDWTLQSTSSNGPSESRDLSRVEITANGPNEQATVHNVHTDGAGSEAQIGPWVDEASVPATDDIQVSETPGPDIRDPPVEEDSNPTSECVQLAQTNDAETKSEIIPGEKEHVQGEAEKIPSVATSEDISWKRAQVKAEDQESPSSRPSSSHSEHSLPLDNPPDSARTSFEEEARKPGLRRSESSKVKQLVEHFDGLSTEHLAPECAELGYAPSRNASKLSLARSLSRGELSQSGEDDFGDFEEGEGLESPNPAPPTKLDKHVSLDKVESGEKVEDLQKETLSSPPHDEALSATGREEQAHDAQLAVEHHGAITFNIDPSHSEALLSSDIQPATLNDSILSDLETPIHDSFSSVEQRKTWYRISRYGTMRKYNAGNDDNYVRVNWAGSTVREETLKVVSRWIMEDRMRGGISFGGSCRPGGLFGWGQPSEELGRFDTKRKDSKGSRVAFDSPIRKSSVTGHERRRSILDGKGTARNSIDLGPTPQFSWSTAQPELQSNHAVDQPVSIPDSNTHEIGTIATISNGSPQAIAQVAHNVDTAPVIVDKSTKGFAFPPPLRPISLPVNPESTGKVQDDDDWGEMVSSPIAISPPSLLYSNRPVHGHRSTKSLMDVLTPQLNSNRSSSRTYHKPSMSETVFDPNHLASNSTPLTPVSQPVTSQVVSLSASGADPWASADFSFFDTPPGPAVKAAAGAPPHHPSKQPNPRSQVPLNPRENLQEQKLVNDIIKSLPDLSYMLRR